MSERIFKYPDDGVCIDKAELEQRGLNTEMFEDPDNTNDPRVQAACAACCVQAVCLEVAVEEIRENYQPRDGEVIKEREIPYEVYGVRAGMNDADIKKLMRRSDIILRRQLALEEQQATAQARLKEFETAV